MALDRAAERAQPRGQPGQVDRHVDRRAPRSAGPRACAQARDRVAPPRVGRVGGQQLGPRAHPHAAARHARKPGELLVGGRRPGGDPLLRERAVGVPERRGHRRGGVLRLLARHDVGGDAGLAQTHGGGEPDHAGADDDRGHGDSTSRAPRSAHPQQGARPRQSRTMSLGRSGPPGAPRSTSGSRP